MIQKGTYRRVSRVAAKEICERLRILGVLEKTLALSPNHSRRTPHYRLKAGRRAFTLLIREYFRSLAREYPLSWQESARYFMAKQYVRKNLNSDLVRSVLAKRGVSIQKQFELSEDGDRKDEKVDRLPIAPPAAKASPKPEVLIQWGPTTPRARAKVSAQASLHYQVEEHEIVYPILALLEVSPSALLFFLGKWNPFIREDGSFSWSSGDTGYETIEHVLFRLIWGAITDLAITRGVPEGYDVTMAGVGYESSIIRVDRQALLELHWRYKEVIDYYAGFDSTHDYYGDGEDIVEIEKNPANAWAKFVWRDDPQRPVPS